MTAVLCDRITATCQVCLADGQKCWSIQRRSSEVDAVIECCRCHAIIRWKDALDLYMWRVIWSAA